MPFGSSQETMTTTDDNAKMKANVEDQNANFTFHLYSFSKCRYAEFYLAERKKNQGICCHHAFKRKECREKVPSQHSSYVLFYTCK